MGRIQVFLKVYRVEDWGAVRLEGFRVLMVLRLGSGLEPLNPKPNSAGTSVGASVNAKP